MNIYVKCKAASERTDFVIGIFRLHTNIDVTDHSCYLASTASLRVNDLRGPVPWNASRATQSQGPLGPRLLLGVGHAAYHRKSGCCHWTLRLGILAGRFHNTNSPSRKLRTTILLIGPTEILVFFCVLLIKWFHDIWVTTFMAFYFQ